MRLLDRESAKMLLLSQGVALAEDIAKVLNGFDFAKPVYEHHFFPGDILYQLIRLPSFDLPSPDRGRWFGLAGITTQKVAVNDSLSGRRAHQFEVIMHFTALEGSAKALPVNLKTGIGGPGGGTQIYVPRLLAGRIRAVGPVERW